MSRNKSPSARQRQRQRAPGAGAQRAPPSPYSSPNKQTMSQKHPARGSREKTARTVLRVVQAGLLSATIVVIAAMVFCDSGYGKIRPEKFHLELADLPQGQDLALRLRRGRTGSNCTSFGLEEDEYFGQYGGVYCGHSVYESPVLSEEAQMQQATIPPAVEAPAWGAPAGGVQPWVPLLTGRQLQRVEVIYKTFDTLQNANEYTWRFWAMHCQDPIPMYAMAEMGPLAPLAGEQGHVLYWDPSRMAWPLPTAVPEVAFAKHFIAVFRTGRTFVYVHLTAQPRNFALDMTPQFVSAVANRIEAQVGENSPGPVLTALRRAAVAIRRHVLRADKVAGRSAASVWRDLVWWTGGAGTAGTAGRRSKPAPAPVVPAAPEAPARAAARQPSPSPSLSPEVEGRAATAGAPPADADGAELPSLSTVWAPLDGSAADERGANGSGDPGSPDAVDELVGVTTDDGHADIRRWGNEDLFALLPVYAILVAVIGLSWFATESA